ncbi:[Fe-Fe] hydrogenase large subunit C-terminal domain-containing protein [Spirochaetia bacterium 38H-sp]|uniref:[Fe-Fe] hydrogenase large subunit C-terminal domain-containing protein n=1 Tax=Rarispira pelagica TaxID=3141764 RepID=A0ABU9UC15_9SPIR
MPREDNRTKIRRDLLVRIARLLTNGTIEEEIDAIPFDMTNEGWEQVRCCIQHDRALLRLRLLALMGFEVEGKEDVVRPLGYYAHILMEHVSNMVSREHVFSQVKEPEAKTEIESSHSSVSLEREANVAVDLTAPLKLNDRFPLHMITEACNACEGARFMVTEACQGCVARPCKTGCPKDATSIVRGRAYIDYEKCINCGLCARVCPFHAIVRIPVPCEEVCPVGAIKKGKDGVARIDHRTCILCGKCLKNCPFGAPQEQSDLFSVVTALRMKRKVIAMLAPAAMAQFPTSPGRLPSALRRIGFDEVVEVAAAADRVAKEEAQEIVERLSTGEAFVATSCCPSWVRAASRLDGIADHVSHTPSPMVMGARLVKEENPNAFVVFIGPCLAKKQEGKEEEAVDAVITIEELGALLVAMEIEVGEEEELPLEETISSYGRGFGASSGVSYAVLHAIDELESEIKIEHRVIDGLSSDSLKEIARWSIDSPESTLVEVMACEGGCVGGPCAIAHPKTSKKLLMKYAGEVNKQV